MVEVFGALANTGVQVGHLYLSLGDDLLGLGCLELLLLNLGGQGLHLDCFRFNLLAVLFDLSCLLFNFLSALGHLLLQFEFEPPHEGIHHDVSVLFDMQGAS